MEKVIPIQHWFIHLQLLWTCIQCCFCDYKNVSLPVSFFSCSNWCKSIFSGFIHFDNKVLYILISVGHMNIRVFGIEVDHTMSMIQPLVIAINKSTPPSHFCLPMSTKCNVVKYNSKVNNIKAICVLNTFIKAHCS